ncbi:hypothetical protein BVC80_1721g3 [Macleaya cordata]|uniref:Mediator of RNA polymerase II transcription subunit 9 n=1 Tax=Macleaya cordata TaxID=56857 RepID=A0A200QCF8_MACCD|nr:hypothetical protein BVC80_1721g3 [Macleaya cordata]
MENPYSSGGSWVSIPNTQSHNITPTSSNQDRFLHHHQQQPQHHHHLQQQQQQQQQRHHHPQQLQQQQQQNHHHPSLASHFHLLHLVENLADAIENGTRDQHSDVLVNELTNNFEKCQQLLNSIAGSINTKAVTVEGQRRKLEETDHLLNQRRDLIAKYKNSVEELIKSER